nr:TadA family conjugal transfer-associated ATPase [Corynebacterium lactis]
MDDRVLLERVRAKLADLPDGRTHADIARIVREETSGVVSDLKMLEILRRIREESVGGGILDRLLRGPNVSDVVVTAPDRVWVDRGQGMQLEGVSFADEEEVRSLAVRLAGRCGRRLDDAQPWADGHIPGGIAGRGVRVHAVLAPPSGTGTQISLRVLRPARRGLGELGAAGLFPAEIQRVLEAIVRAQLSFIVAGGTGAGKTTLLAAMLSEVPADQRIVCIEDTPELDPGHPHVVKLVTRAANVEGAGAIGQQELVRQALRMRPDRIVVGEIRGGEVVDLLAALNTGHRGGAGTLHANRVEDVLARFEALGLIGGLDREALHSQLSSAVQVVLIVRRQAEGRRLAEIGVVVGVSGAGGAAPRLVRAWSYDEGPAEGWETLQGLLASVD